MDFSKLSPNNWIAGGGGLVALINMFLPWYGLDFGFGNSVSANAWNSGFLAWLGALLAVAAGAVIVLKAVDVFDAQVANLSSEQLGMVLGAAGAVLILLKRLTDNDFIKFGIYLGLLSAGAAAVGAFLSGQDVGVGIPEIDDFKGDGGGSAKGDSSTF